MLASTLPIRAFQRSARHRVRDHVWERTTPLGHRVPGKGQLYETMQHANGSYCVTGRREGCSFSRATSCRTCRSSKGLTLWTGSVPRSGDGSTGEFLADSLDWDVAELLAGDETDDLVFCLSAEEAKRYMDEGTSWRLGPAMT